MGNCCAVEGAIDHWIYVKTGDRKGAGTDANVRCILYDDQGNQSDEIPLDCYFRNDYERGKTDIFQAPPLGHSWGKTVRIELWRDNEGVYSNWFCEVVVVNDRRDDTCAYFPVLRWLQSGVRYKIDQYDTCLPQLSQYVEQRQWELDQKRQLYQYAQAAPDLPVQVHQVPPDEQFSDDFKWDILTTKNALLSKSSLGGIPRGRWEDLEDITEVFDNIFYEPAGTDRWSNDICFGAQRLIGCNPCMIRLATSLPENMGLTSEMLRPFLEGWTLKQIIDAKRLYMVDLKILEDLPTKDDWPVCAPIALLFITGDKQLVPIAIQLWQDIAPDNPVYLPNDPPFTWLLAKMWFNNADAQVHQALTHLGFTHYLMEGIAMAMNRHLSVAHPIHKLLAPHFTFLLAINATALNQLVAPEGWIDNCMSMGREGLFELIRRGAEEWRIDIHGSFPRELETRGVLDPKTLPNYAYRDDGILIYKAIDQYVSKILKHYYDMPGKIQGDYELQNWVAELATPKEMGGVGIKGIPHGGRFSTIQELQMVCTSIVFTCTAQHAATNFSMYDEYAFCPNYPTKLEGDPPIDKLPKSEEDIVEALPSKENSVETMVITKLLSARGSKSLAEWEFQYQYDPAALKIEKEFREELQQISRVIKQRNEQREDIFKYPYLDPEVIPNSISI